MDVASIEHLIYAPVPYKGYSIRAKSRAANIESFKTGFKDFFIPFDQSIIHREFLEKVIVVGKDKVHLARVFQAQGLDELKRSGVVSHIAEIPRDLLLQKKLLLSSLDSLMAEFIEKNGLPIGEISPLGVPSDSGKDIETDVIRENIPEESLRKLLKQSDLEKFKEFVIYKNSDVDILSYGLARALSAITSKSILIASARIKFDLLFLYDGVLITGQTLPAWARVKGWSVLNLTKEGVAETVHKPIEAIIKDIYKNEETSGE